MTVTLEYAQQHLPELVEAAGNGEFVAIARPDGAELVLAPSEVATSSSPRPSILGMWQGRIQIPTTEEWEEMDREILADFGDDI